METRTLQLVLQYNGAHFAGWQRQPDERTVQGVVEEAMTRLTGTRISVLGAGRTDAGVHALGQAAGVIVPPRWTHESLSRALNAVLPSDVRVARAYEMTHAFHARYSATSRSYRYLVGIDDEAENPFRIGRELAFHRALDLELLRECASMISGDHCFRGFAVKGTAPESDNHRCIVSRSEWVERTGGLTYAITANRFLHHMVRFLVSTMLEVGSGKRDKDVIGRLLASDDNRDVSPPAPPYGLYLERVEYPRELYLVSS